MIVYAMSRQNCSEVQDYKIDIDIDIDIDTKIQNRIYNVEYRYRNRYRWLTMFSYSNILAPF